ncbi:MAG TPA: glycosyltransferase [Polyangiaceae bacterium]|jgi:glycosyltransferase involved in cell wall biosynthesis
MTRSQPKVSICVITYNHAPYIAQTLDSILGQEVDFDYEIVVADDASTDRTRDILLEYARKHPGTFQLILQEKNIGQNANFRSLMRQPRGTYIALLDGDDYWTSSKKLQVQVDFLERNPDFAFCFHDVVIVEDGKATSRLCPPSLPEVPELEGLFESNFVPASSVLYRRGLFGDDFPAWWLDLQERTHVGDWSIHVLNAEHGKMRYFNEVWGTYRRHPNGSWSALGAIDLLERTIEVLATLNRAYGYRFDHKVRRRIGTLRLDLAVFCARAGRHREGARNLKLGYALASDWSDRLVLSVSFARSVLRPSLALAFRKLRSRGVRTKAARRSSPTEAATP